MIDHSRVARLGAGAAKLTEEEVLAHLDANLIHISAEAGLAGGMLTLRVLVTTLRRMPGRLNLDPRGLDQRLVDDLVRLVRDIDSAKPLEIGDAVPAGAVHIHVGLEARAPGAIRVIPDGYGMHVARDAAVTIVQARPAHPLGSVLAAAFAAAEAFKDAAPVVDDRCHRHDHLTWCAVSLSHDLTAAPMHDGPLVLDVALAGCGAVGTAVALILSELDASGDVLVLDRQDLGPENIATYSLGGEEDGRLRRRKVDLVAEALGRKYNVTRRHGDLATLAADVDNGRVRCPPLFLTGLDSVTARHEVQRLWPERLIDAGTGDTAVGLHYAVAGSGPCLMCFLPPGGHRSAVELRAERTGLSVELLGRGDDVLLEEDLAELDPEQRELLLPHVGKKICNLANAPGLIERAGDFQAAVTFVALQAACLAVGRLVAAELKLEMYNFIQYDSLIGPRADAAERRKRNSECYCQTKAERIRKVREERMAPAAEGGSSGR